MDLMGDFVRQWTHPEYPPEPVAQAELEAVADHLDISFPKLFKDSLIAHGAPTPTRALLDAIVEKNLPLADLSEFLTPPEIVRMTLDYRSAGMAPNLVVFALDGMGNAFVFAQEEPEPIWLFDHDHLSVTQLASDFAVWLSAYCDIEGSWRDLSD